MICQECGCRFAPFSEQDFNYVEKQDPLYGQTVEFVPKNEDAERKRRTLFESNERRICETCLEEADTYLVNDNQDQFNF